MQKLEIKGLRKQDHKKAIKATIKGMHFIGILKTDYY